MLGEKLGYKVDLRVSEYHEGRVSDSSMYLADYVSSWLGIAISRDAPVAESIRFLREFFS